MGNLRKTWNFRSILSVGVLFLSMNAYAEKNGCASYLQIDDRIDVAGLIREIESEKINYVHVKYLRMDRAIDQEIDRALRKSSNRYQLDLARAEDTLSDFVMTVRNMEQYLVITAQKTFENYGMENPDRSEEYQYRKLFQTSRKDFIQLLNGPVREIYELETIDWSNREIDEYNHVIDISVNYFKRLAGSKELLAAIAPIEAHLGKIQSLRKETIAKIREELHSRH